jgi:hypothetical protein
MPVRKLWRRVQIVTIVPADHKPQIYHRSESCRTSAYYDARITAQHIKKCPISTLRTKVGGQTHSESGPQRSISCSYKAHDVASVWNNNEGSTFRGQRSAHQPENFGKGITRRQHANRRSRTGRPVGNALDKCRAADVVVPRPDLRNLSRVFPYDFRRGFGPSMPWRYGESDNVRE